MPTEIKPLFGGGPDQQPRTIQLVPQSFQWLQRQAFDFDRYEMGTSPYRTGSLRGGPTEQQWGTIAGWRQNATVPDPPRLTETILAGKKQPRTGALTLNMLDPFATITELTGSFGGREEPLVGEGAAWDPWMFLAAKGIDPFGVGSTGAPARLADYTVAPLIAAGQMILGQKVPANPYGDTFYPFQRDSAYWQMVSALDDTRLHQVAVNVVARMADPTSNGYLVDMLEQQFRIDRNKALGLSSGTASIDYFAKKGLSLINRVGTLSADSPTDAQWAASMGYTAGSRGEPLTIAGFLRNLPFAGPAFAEAINPLTPEENAAWEAATPDQRRNLLGGAGLSMMVNELPGYLVTMSGVGAAATLAKGGAGLAGKAYWAYDTALKVSKASMALGLTSAATNWALEASWPEDFDFGPITGQGVSEYVRRVDLARPVSQSYLAGVVNGLGFWSSGTFGAATAVKAGRKAAGTLGDLARAHGIPVPMPGLPDLRLFAFGLGGSDMRRLMVGELGLSEQGITLSAKRLWLSLTLNQIRRKYIAAWDSAAMGLRTGTLVDNLPVEQRMELATQQLARPLSEASGEVEAVVRTYQQARELGPLLSDDAIRTHNLAVRNARSHDDALARGFVNEYGAGFITRLAGADTPAAIRGWLEDAVTRLGGRAAGLPSAATHSLEWWHQLARGVYHYAFDRWAGLLAHAAEGTEEAARLGIVSQRHLFRDEADAAIRVLREGGDAAAAKMDELLPKLEVEEWDARGLSAATRQKKPWTRNPDTLADHLEDIRDTLIVRRRLPDAASDTAGEPLNALHRQISDEGLWEIGYKPVNEAGEFMATVQTRTGQMFSTRWLDYPLSSVSNIEMGNRGILASKLDSVTRGYRTWRILEMQRGALFRSLSDKGIGSPTQVSAFHEGVLALSRKHALSPQAVGRAPTWIPGMEAMAGEVDALARRIFGEGPHLDVNGKPINWRREIGSAYRTAYRLNLTAGLTSHLKASLGPLGEAIVAGSDFLYVMWRFALSPLFKAGEIWESLQLGAMRRVNPNADPLTENLFYRTGIGQDPSIIGAELTGDMFLQGLGRDNFDPRVPLASDAGIPARAYSMEQRNAASLSFFARQLPEDFDQLRTRMALADVARRFRERAMAGQALRPVTRREALVAELIDLTDEAGFPVAGQEARFREVVSELDYEELDPLTRAALEAWPAGGPTAESIDAAIELDNQAAAVRARGALRVAADEGGPPAPAWLRDAMESQGLDPDRMFNDVDLTNPTVREAIRNDPALTEVERQVMLETGSLRRATYERLVADGHLPPDPQIALRARYRATIDEIEKGFGVNRLTGYFPDRRLLVDPVTGIQIPELAGGSWPGGRVTDRVLRSLRARMGAVRVAVPDWEEMALRLEARAQALRTDGVPVTRNARVGSVPPAGYELDPAMVYIPGQPNGTATWIDEEGTIAADRGMWHATTAIDGVMDTGLLSRKELMERAEPPEARAALTRAYQDEGIPASEFRIELWSGSEAHVSAPELETYLRGDSRLLYDHYTGNLLPWNEIRWIRRRDTGDVIWQSQGQGFAREGLSASSPDQLVSMTTEWAHAETIAERLKAVGMAARGEMTVDQLIDHFGTYYDELTGGDIASLMSMADAMFLKHAIRSGDPQVAYEQLTRAMQARIDATLRIMGGNPGPETVRMFKELDQHLRRVAHDTGYQGFNGSVVLTGDWRAYAQIDPEQVGVVRVAVRGRPLDELDKLPYSEIPRVGPDQFEIQVPSRDVFVVDERITGEPLASDEYGLLRQLRQTIDDRGDTVPGLQARHDEITDRLTELRSEAIDPTPATTMAEVHGSSEDITNRLEEAVTERVEGRRWPNLRGLARNLWDPIPFKEGIMGRQMIQMQREEFPRILAGTRVEPIFREVAGPEQGWADWLVKDRELFDRWQATMDPGDLDTLIAHAGGDSQRRMMDDLYNSEEWQVITSLWSLNAAGASDEAFAAHFFDQYRSPILRSINHPVLGVYPASWALKTAREWAKFLFDNRMFGVDLRLGMTPAVAISQLTRQQAVAFAQDNPDTEGDLNKYLDDGPMGSTLFVFNLLMPGDWASLPFPLARSVREVVRGNYDPGSILQRNIDYLGVTRDARLLSEMGGEFGSLVFGKPQEPGADGWIPVDPSAAGGPLFSKPRTPPSWSEESRR